MYYNENLARYYTDEWISDLKEYLEHNPEYFIKRNMVDTINDVIKFRIREPIFIMFEGEHFLCDFYSNELWIVQLLAKKKYDKIRKDYFTLKPVVKVVDKCSDKFPCFNGYWKIPNVSNLEERVSNLEQKGEK